MRIKRSCSCHSCLRFWRFSWKAAWFGMSMSMSPRSAPHLLWEKHTCGTFLCFGTPDGRPWWGTTPPLTLPLPSGHHMRSVAKYAVCNLHAAVRCWMLTSCVSSNFWYILKPSWALRVNISGLFYISLRLLLDENYISKVNDLAGKGLKPLLFLKHFFPIQVNEPLTSLKTTLVLFFVFVTSVLSHWNFSLWEIQVVFPRKSQQWQRFATQCTVHAGCFSVSITT